MRLWMALLALGPACGFGGGSNSNPGDDAMTMKDAPGPDARQCFGSFLEVCFNSAENLPTTPYQPTDAMTEINTDMPAMCNPNFHGADDYCILAGAGFTLSATQTIRAYGSRPLVLLSTSSTAAFDILGTIDVSSNHNVAGVTGIGAGAKPAAQCTGASAAVVSGGGPGGSFIGKGGNGEQVPDGGGATGGTAAAAIPPPTMLRGGCPGGDGAGAGNGTGGAGGGVVDVIAIAAIHFEGTINASGAGGKAGTMMLGGGGGGGSGGMIVFDALTVTGAGLPVANGGGGGQGGPTGTSGGESAAPSTAAAGGNNQALQGGKGGDGGYTVKPNGFGGQNSSGNGGGGGGGGGIGVVKAPV